MDPSPSVRGNAADGLDPPRAAAEGARSPASPLGRVLLPRILGVPVLTVGLLTFAAVVVLGNYLPTMANAAATSRALERSQERNFQLARRIRALEAEAERLENDPWINERILRDELRMTRPGEARLK